MEGTCLPHASVCDGVKRTEGSLKKRKEESLEKRREGSLKTMRTNRQEKARMSIHQEKTNLLKITDIINNLNLNSSEKTNRKLIFRKNSLLSLKQVNPFLLNLNWNLQKTYPRKKMCFPFYLNQNRKTTELRKEDIHFLYLNLN
ncbi:hypothetical protein E2C01_073821 [Portunus trituberculatus]|uniref:Uncharacterized protein n=1 Tax=Portunus trituberculatus TaxID=210409 RepID=A0A5B7I402_PORTR|nr:hypothetical protein [Portunus trituberculatus]